ncbi:MAG: hypothetical protein EB059_09365 [Alphaproteobacteria bacterium]|nr:hypothetical protein [Alphaproteobacteria bacterium]
MKLIITLCMALLFLAPQLARAGECYTPDEFEAEQGLRLHTDLEVIMLTCKYDGYRKPLRDSYAVFLKKYSLQIRKWENTIARVYAATGGSRNEVIDNFRTALANQKGHESSIMGPRPFCVAYANWVLAVSTWTPQQVMSYVRTPDPARQTRKPPC